MRALYNSVYFRYFFFDWLFKDVNVKGLYARAAAERHNMAHRHHLLVYLRRWIVVMLFNFGMGAWLESTGLLACVFFYTLSALSACTISKTAAAWFLMGRPQH